MSCDDSTRSCFINGNQGLIFCCGTFLSNDERGNLSIGTTPFGCDGTLCVDTIITQNIVINEPENLVLSANEGSALAVAGTGTLTNWTAGVGELEGFNLTTGIFVAPSEGFYSITYSVNSDIDFSVTSGAHAFLLVNNTQGANQVVAQSGFDNSGTVAPIDTVITYTLNGAATVYLNAGGTVQVQVQPSTGGGTQDFTGGKLYISKVR